MKIPEPIDLLKRQKLLLEKSIEKCTVANYKEVSENLNPIIKKYEEAIDLLDEDLLEVDEDPEDNDFIDLDFPDYVGGP